MHLRITQILLLCLIPFVSIAQNLPDVYQLDRTAEKKTCYLPDIYFKSNTAEVEETYLEDMAFIAYLMKKHKKIKIRVHAEIIPNPYNTRGKLLTEERLSYFTWLMKDRFGINPKRILKPEYSQLTRGYTPAQSALALDKQKLACDCVWKGK